MASGIVSGGFLDYICCRYARNEMWQESRGTYLKFVYVVALYGHLHLEYGHGWGLRVEEYGVTKRGALSVQGHGAKDGTPFHRVKNALESKI